MSRRNLLGLPRARRERKLVAALTGATLLLWIGGSAILPLLPAYLRARGSKPVLVGAVMAAYFAASVLTQYPIGRLSDRIGRRPVVLCGLVVFAAGSIGFALTSGPALAIVCRALQGVGAGAFTVAAAATIGSQVPSEERGAAFGALYGSQMLALAIGPLAGSVAGVAYMGPLFLAAGAAAIVAIVPILVVVPRDPAAKAPTRSTPSSARVEEMDALASCAPGGLARPAPGPRLPLSGPVVGVLLVFAATGLLAGVYESCWTLLLDLRHATSFDVGLSWTLFALPFALLSIPAGHLADRFDQRGLVIVALASSAGFCALYPFLHSIPALIVCCTLEAIGAVIGTPAAVLVLSRCVASEAQGEAQGSVETARVAATAVAAAGSGALFGVGPVYPFTVAAGIALFATGAIAIAWRRLSSGVTGGSEAAEALVANSASR